MKKALIGFLVGVLTLVMATSTISFSSAQLGSAQYEGESFFSAFSPSVIFAGGYKTSLDGIKELRNFGVAMEALGIAGENEIGAFADTLQQIDEITLIVAVNNLYDVNFDDLEANDPKNFCFAARLDLQEPLRSEFLEGKPADILHEEVYGYDYLTTAGCMKHPDLDQQSQRMNALASAGNTHHNVFAYVNKGFLQGEFMKSEAYQEMKGWFTAEALMEELYLYDDEGMLDMSKKPMIDMFLATMAHMNLVEMIMDSKRIYVGLGYQNGMLSHEMNVEFGDQSLMHTLNEVYDGSVRMGKIFLTDTVRVSVAGKSEGNISYNSSTYSDLDASIFFVGGGNMMTNLFIMGMLDSMFAPSYDDYYYEDEMYMMDEDMMMEMNEAMDYEFEPEYENADDFFMIEQ